MQTPGLSRCQAHISVWIVLLSALTIIPRFLCFYVVSPTNGIASCDTCETKRADKESNLAWLSHTTYFPVQNGITRHSLTLASTPFRHCPHWLRMAPVNPSDCAHLINLPCPHEPITPQADSNRSAAGVLILHQYRPRSATNYTTMGLHSLKTPRHASFCAERIYSGMLLAYTGLSQSPVWSYLLQESFSRGIVASLIRGLWKMFRLLRCKIRNRDGGI